MCGRFVRTFTIGDLVSELEAVDATDVSLEPNWNIPPTSKVHIVGLREGQRVVRVMEWGLIPKWAMDTTRQSSMINARVESAHEKPAFRNLVRTHRVVFPMSGFYEWHRVGQTKTPYYFTPRAGNILFVGALWSSWTDPGSGTNRATVAMLTTNANEDMSEVHDRMPCVLNESDIDAWLNPGSDHLIELATAGTVPTGTLLKRQVDSRVNAVRNNGPDLIA